jgi:hypothetical protein
VFLCVLASLRSEFFLTWPFGTMSSPKFEPVTYAWSLAEKTRKLKGHSAVSPNALCDKHSGESVVTTPGTKELLAVSALGRPCWRSRPDYS